MAQELCPNCFEPGYQGGSCRRCGYQKGYDKKGSGKALPPGTLLRQRFYVGKLLGEGGFGLTYKAFDTQANKICAVKEYAPNGLCIRTADGRTLELTSRDQEMPYRAGLRRFLDESRILSRLEQIPSVVDITDTFQENNTAYFVMEFLDGADLRQIVKAARQQLPVEQITNIILQVAVSMDVIHTRSGIIHRDISPENIYITRDGKVKLIDFGSAKRTENGMGTGLSVVLKPKFAPPEQFSSEMAQGSFTDVYSLANTFYYALTGASVPSAPDRLAGKEYVPLKHLNLGVPEGVSDAVDHALILNVRHRTQTMQTFIQEIALGSQMAVSQPVAGARPGAAGQPVAGARPGAAGQPVAGARPGAAGQPVAGARPGAAGQPVAGAAAQGAASGAAEGPGFARAAQRGQAGAPGMSGTPGASRTPGTPGTPGSGAASRPPKSGGKRPAARFPYVSIVAGPETGKNWVLPPDRPMTMGRSMSEANLRVQYPENISRIHCRITYVSSNGKFSIRDLSANGVFYKGKRLQKGVDYQVKPPARFMLAGSSCVIEVGVRYEYR